MKEKLKSKTVEFVNSVTADSRWDLQNELMVQVLGFTLYGYAFGIGRLILFMDAEEINKIIENELTGIGIGLKYAQGLVEAAHGTFIKEEESINSQLVEVGHSNFAAEDISECVESIFENTELLQNATP